MSILQCFSLSLYNLWRRKKYSISLIRSILIIMTLSIVINVLISGINKEYDNIIYKSASINSLEIILKTNDTGEYVENDNYKLLKLISEFESVEKEMYTCPIDIPKYLKREDMYFVNNNLVTMNIDGINYNGINDFTYDFDKAMYGSNKSKSNYTVPFKVNLVDYQGETFFENEMVEFEHKYPNEKLILAGRMLSEKNELIITDYMLEKFGVKNYEDILSKKVSFYVEEKELINQYKIVGIINSNFYRIKSRFQSSQILISADKDTYREFKPRIVNCRIPIKDYINSVPVINKAYDLKIGEFSPAIFADQFYFVSKVQAVVNYIFKYVAFFICLAILLSLFSILYTNIKEKYSYFGILQAIGFTNKNLVIIFICEIIVINIIALLISFVFSILILYIFNNFMVVLTGVKLPFDLLSYINISLITLLAISIVFIVITFLLIIKVLLNQIAITIKG